MIGKGSDKRFLYTSTKPLGLAKFCHKSKKKISIVRSICGQIIANVITFKKKFSSETTRQNSTKLIWLFLRHKSKEFLSIKNDRFYKKKCCLSIQVRDSHSLELLVTIRIMDPLTFRLKNIIRLDANTCSTW